MENAQLQELIKATEVALREAELRKSQFLDTLAHELRNPLTPLRNGLQVMQAAGGDTHAMNNARAMMKQQIQHMVRLIDDLLDISRITLGKVELQRQLLDIDHVVQTIHSRRASSGTTGPAIKVRVSDAPLPVHADMVRLAQVLENLLDDAASYTPVGGQISLSAEREGEQVIIRIADAGLPLPAERRVRAFDLFAPAGSDVATQSGPSTGLSIARQLIEMHDGTIEGWSAGLGRGTEYIVRLPLVPAHADLSIQASKQPS